MLVQRLTWWTYMRLCMSAGKQKLRPFESSCHVRGPTSAASLRLAAAVGEGDTSITVWLSRELVFARTAGVACVCTDCDGDPSMITAGRCCRDGGRLVRPESPGMKFSSAPWHMFSLSSSAQSQRPCSAPFSVSDNEFAG